MRLTKIFNPKEKDSSGISLLPKGFHLNGVCVKNGDECIIHSIFGGMGYEGKISVSVDPIAFIKETKNLQLARRVQLMHIATENRHCRTFDGKIAQNFTEKYASGVFTCEIDVTPLNKPELGLVIEGAMRMERLGGGFNAGYGRIAVTKFQLIRRSKEWKKRLVDGWFEVSEEVTEEPLNQEVKLALQAWEDYVFALTR
jgi:hypothetical protein